MNPPNHEKWIMPPLDPRMEEWYYLMQCFYQEPHFQREISQLRQLFGVDPEKGYRGGVNMRGQGARSTQWGKVSRNPDDATYCKGVRELAETIGLPPSWGPEALHRCVLDHWMAFDDSLFFEGLDISIKIRVTKPGIVTPRGKLRETQTVMEVTPHTIAFWASNSLEELREEFRKAADQLWEALQPVRRGMPGYQIRRRGQDQLERDVEWLYRRMRNKERYKDIADSSGYDEEYVKRRVWQTAKAMGIRLRQSIPLKP